MTSLYNLTQDYRKLLAKEEYTDEDMANLNNLNGLIEDKIVQCAYVIKELEAKLALTNEAIAIAYDKAERINNNLEKLRNYVLRGMMENNIELVDKDPMFDIKVKANPEYVDNYNDDEIPDDYWMKKESYQLDKKKIKEHIRNGQVVPGATLNRNFSLQIK